MKKSMFIKNVIIFLILSLNGFSNELIDQYNIKYKNVDLISVPEFYNNDKSLIIYIDYFIIFPEYRRIKRENYIGYQNNCMDSRIYFDDNQINIYEVYFDRKKCDGKIKMIVDKSDGTPKISRYKK